jgi:DDE superfamily endonuclease
MDITLHTNQLEQFRRSLYQNFSNRADTLLDLVDAMSSTPDAKSVVEYSIARCFRRSYSTIFKAIDVVNLPAMWLAEQVAPSLVKPKAWPFWLLMVDVTTNPRPYAKTLGDRSMVYQPEVVKGKLPVTIGHQYSTVALGLEPEAGVSSSWVLPLLTMRVSTDADKEQVGMEQIGQLLRNEKLPFGKALTVEVADSSYSKPAALYAHRPYPNLVTIVRARGTRTFYHSPVVSEEARAKPGKGHPTWYGAAFSLSTAATQTPPDETQTLWETSRRGKQYRVEIQAWHQMLMPGESKPVSLPMHEHPFTLVRIVRYDKEGNLACKHPLWLIVMGKRRQELILTHIYQAYLTRFDMEHFFRFGKQKLLLVGFQTPEVAHEENWFQLAHIAYAQLWLARHLAQGLPKPWERNLPFMRRPLISPTLVQRDFDRIIRQLGTPAQPPKPRGISPGRRKGQKLPRRLRKKVIVKRQIAKK